MTAPDLTPAERAVVERFEQAPDALAGANICERHHFVWTWPIEGGSGSVGVCELCGAVTTGERDARIAAEAADAREAEVRARIAQAIEAHPARWLNADGTTSPILPATTASAAPPEPNNVPSQAYLKALVAAEQDRLRAEGWRACVDHIRRVYASWLMPEDTYWVGRHNPYAASEAPDRHDLSEAVET